MATSWPAITQAIPQDINGLIQANAAGGAIELFRWNKLDLTQFTQTDMPPNTAAGVADFGVQTSSTIGFQQVPLMRLNVTNGLNQPSQSLFYTPNSYQSVGGNIVIGTDWYGDPQPGFGATVLLQHGLIWAAPTNPTTNFYILTKNSSMEWRLYKVIANVLYQQTSGSVISSRGFENGLHPRVKWIIRADGSCAVYAGDHCLFRHPMTIGVATVIPVGRPGWAVARNQACILASSELQVLAVHDAWEFNL